MFSNVYFIGLLYRKSRETDIPIPDHIENYTCGGYEMEG
jgi:hypothetical protein